MKTSVICFGGIHGETIYTTRAFDPTILPTRLRSLLKSATAIQANEGFFGYAGGGYLAALGLSRLGIEVGLLSSLGQDNLGSGALLRLKAEGINAARIDRGRRVATPITTVIRSPQDGRFTMSTQAMSEDIGKLALSRLEGTDASWLYLANLGGSTKLLKLALVWAKRTQTKVMVRVSQDDVASPRKMLTLLARADVVVFERSDAELLTHQGEPEQCLIALRTGGLKTVVIQDDTAAAWIVHDGFIYSATSPRNYKCLNANGVYDALAACFLASLIKEGDVAKALDFGLSAARLAGSYIGSESGYPKNFPHRSGKVSKKFL